MLENGIYEQLITLKIKEELVTLNNQLSSTVLIDKAEAPKILARYVAEIIQRKLEEGENAIDASRMVDYINQLLEALPGISASINIEHLLLAEKGEQLMEIVPGQNQSGNKLKHLYISRPETSLIESSLFTGAIHEPSLFSELKKEILSSNNIDMLVSFIKWSGLRLIFEELKTFTDNGGQLRVITTSYMGATDLKAIEELRKLNNTSIKISYDTKRTRLHAKAYIFYRNTGFSTSYVGSSNLSNAAISSGLEWNLKIAAKDQPETFLKIKASFESYWNSVEFESYNSDNREQLANALQAEYRGTGTNANPFNFEIRPYNFQQDILDRLQAEREIHGHFRNLIVAATGTGKTVTAAFDYKRFCQNTHGSMHRLLFIAHREEILEQSISCFRGVLKDANFGELSVGRIIPEKIDYLFMSIQTFNSKRFEELTTADFYDYIIVDEFHHAAAPSYQALLSHYQPRILLGLTATPERMDGLSVLNYFEHRIAAQIRLPEAIDRKLLCPFQYFGVTDIVDLRKLKWIRGGYDRNELSNVYTMDQKIAETRAGLIFKKVHEIVTDIDEVKGLGFCVSVKHADYMSSFFNQHGIPALSLNAGTPKEQRGNAKYALLSGEIKFIFAVDLYNEGVDIPEINTVLFLRPTESLTVFLQQLGRGLRLAEDKDCLTVMDFIGQASQRYNFEQKFKALQTPVRKSIQQTIKQGSFSVPAGCFIHLEKIASSYILKNIRESFGNKTALLSRITQFSTESEMPLNLENFLEYHQLSVSHFYPKYNFSRLCVEANQMAPFAFKDEDIFNKGLARIGMIDSRKWLKFLLDLLEAPQFMLKRKFKRAELRMINMFIVTIWPLLNDDYNPSTLFKRIEQLQSCSVLYRELYHLLKWQFDRVDFIAHENPAAVDVPLEVHCSYTRNQILLAYDYINPNSVREGVKHLPDFNTDLFFITLNKSDKDYSPSTMYNDYSISETLFHVQSQSTISESSNTGQRYIHHQQNNEHVLLFVREYRKIDQQTAPYIFLGPVSYVQHEGSRPMSIVWKLDIPIPAKFMNKTNKLMTG